MPVDLELLIAAARRRQQRQASRDDIVRLRAVRVLPLGGGSTRAVYTFTVDGAAYCLKFYAVDEAGRAAREWGALQFLTAHGFRSHPRPFCYSSDPAWPIWWSITTQPCCYL